MEAPFGNARRSLARSDSWICQEASHSPMQRASLQATFCCDARSALYTTAPLYRELLADPFNLKSIEISSIWSAVLGIAVRK